MYLMRNYEESNFGGNEIVASFHNTLMLLFKNTVKPFIIFKIDCDLSPDYIIDVNEAFCNRLDYSRAELLSKDPSRIFGERMEEEKKIDNLGAAISENAVIRQYFLKKDGRKIPFEIFVHFSMIDNSRFGLAMAIEITQALSIAENSLGKKYSEKDITVRTNLRRAIEREDFLIYYQPKINVVTGKISGAEALIRWNHAGNIIPPTTFIPIAEESKLIIPIGEWILYNSCKQSIEWKNKLSIPLHVSVNISAVQLQHKDFFDTVVRILKDTKADPRQIDLEITESAVINNFHSSNEVLNDLRQMGINISLDDFGTGYSSLSYLRNLNIDNLKVDRSFIKDIVKDKKNMAIVKSIIEMAHSLGIAVTAEGIEDFVQFSTLRRFQCDYVQGFLFSKPLPKDEFEKYLLSQKEMVDQN